MPLIILILAWTAIVPCQINKNISGEYEGGMPFTIWASLELKENGRYEYSVSTHQSIYTKDKGTWKIRNDQLILNSLRKIRKKYRGEKRGKSRFLFKEFKFNIKEDVLEFDKKNKFTFNETYFHLTKKIKNNKSYFSGKNSTPK
jgi:hypothetical protein